MDLASRRNPGRGGDRAMEEKRRLEAKRYESDGEDRTVRIDRAIVAAAVVAMAVM